MRDINSFLNRFHSSDDINTVFTCGCCYWFAQILFIRFIRDDTTIMYSISDNHFGTRINGRVYDITGDVTDKYDWKPWIEFQDDVEKERIVRDCIMF